MSPTLTAKAPRRPPSKQVPDKDTAPMNATAAKLLVAAGDLMIERNSTEVSLSEIAQKSGVNAALVKYHFGNKDGLLLALLARDAASEMANLAFVLDQPISPTEKMRRHIAGIINAYYRVPYLSRLIHLLLHQGSEETSKEVHRFFINPLFDFVRGLLEQGVEAGEFRKVDPALFYISLNGACDNLFYGRQMNARFLGSKGITDEVRRQYIGHMTTLFLGGLLTDKAGMPSDMERPSTAKT
ncbi:AcrR family transcriptional regulator [Afipia massiliensis]|uniref:AcrR family transcriptional regulator n=1 Tax=Afipia massiliensis TaxID=211460 RepID=A0A840N3K3_9BRAD|nr:TetR family transcriptional regulator [Afipia massiliensis]MBB5052468.1 AcrR family transcriptional regulator [Afipia massiliensis]